MINNDVLRRVRYLFDFNDKQMIEIFGSAGYIVTRAQVTDWLKKDDDPKCISCADRELALFLNGLINEKRGKREGAQPEPEQRLNNNMIFRKLRIALDMQADDIMEVMELADFNMSKHELSAFFRKPGHRHYKECKDQILRNFLKGLQIKHRPAAEDTSTSSSTEEDKTEKKEEEKTEEHFDKLSDRRRKNKI